MPWWTECGCGDRDIGYGHSGILASELKAALYKSASQPNIKGYILGLGGRDIRNEDIINHGRASNEINIVSWETLDDNMIGAIDPELWIQQFDEDED